MVPDVEPGKTGTCAPRGPPREIFSLTLFCCYFSVFLGSPQSPLTPTPDALSKEMDPPAKMPDYPRTPAAPGVLDNPGIFAGGSISLLRASWVGVRGDLGLPRNCYEK